MNTKTKYILLTLAISAFGLIIFNNYKAYYWYSIVPELEYSKMIFGIGVLCVGFYYFVKKWRKRLAKIMIGAFGICLVLNLYLVTEYYKTVQSQNRLSEYYELETCEEMEIRFDTDLKNGVIKYFQFGIGYDIELKNVLKDNYKIETFGMGCIIQSEMICYNDLVNDYLKENYNDRIIDF